MRIARDASYTQHLFICLPAAVIPCIASLFYFKWYSDSAFAQHIYFGTKIFTCTWPIVAYMLYRGTLSSLHEDVRESVTGDRVRQGILYGVVSGAVVSAFILGVYFFTGLGELVRDNASAIRAKAVQLGFLDHYYLFAAFLSVIHSFIEEVYWRWCVYGTLRYLLRSGYAMLFAGLFFASHHFVVLTEYVPVWAAFFCSLGVGFGGVLWSWIYEKQKSLLGAWISHMIIDMAIMYIGSLILFQ